MYSVTKWMLVAALIGVNSDAIARMQAYELDRSEGDTSCKAPLLCIPGVRPNLEGGRVTDGMPASPEGVSKERDGRFRRIADPDGAPGSVGKGKGVGSSDPRRFACGEVVSGYTVTCTNGSTKALASAPEIDTSLAAGGAMFVMGCLAILHGRKRRLAANPVGR